MKTIQRFFLGAIALILLAANAHAGRWLSPDPIEHMERDPRPGVNATMQNQWKFSDELNLYQFVGNNPVNNIDPYGLSIWSDFGDWELSAWDRAFVGSAGSGPDPNSQGAKSANAGYGFHDLTANGDPNGERLGNPASAVGGSVVHSLVTAATMMLPGGGAAKGLKCEARNLQKIFDKHGADFGLTGNWNPSRLMDVAKALGSHVDDPAVQTIPGTYRGIPGINYVNPTTGANVFTDTSGNVLAAWKLGADQLQSVLNTGRLF